MRDHQPILLEEFNGLFKRGDKEACPLDHFADCENIFFFQDGFRTRDGIDTYLAVGNVVRIHTFNMAEGQSILLLNDSGQIFHAIGEAILYGPILSIPEMEDFSSVSWAGRAYITPITRSVTTQGTTYETGMEDEVLYVYAGDGSDARPAAGDPPSGDGDTPMVAYNSILAGSIDLGVHIIGVTFGDSMGGDSTAIGTTIKPVIYALGNLQATIQNIPIGGVGITQRFIWMTRAINPDVYDPTESYDFYLAATIDDNTTVSINIDIADVDLTTLFSAGSLPNPTSGGIQVENTNQEGYCDLGLHIVGVVYETVSGYLTAPGPEVLGVQTYANENRKIAITNIPISPSPYVIRRHLVSSKRILNYNGDDFGYQLFFIPGGTLDDNTTEDLTLSYYDIELLDDASHLLDNFAEIPAGAALGTYHGRLVLGATFNDISILYLSAPGEPEAIDQVDGVIIIPLDGNPITVVQELRDILYTFKQTRCYAINDNGDVPSTWATPVAIDQGIGCSIFGIATVLDSGGVNVDFLLITDYSGFMIFNGSFLRPELSSKIQDFWLAMDRLFFGRIQTVNDTVNQRIFMTLPDKKMLYCDYSNGLDAKLIKWGPLRFDIETNTIALIGTDTLIIGSTQEAV